uniref:FBA_2 domain-containing protein n=1 Tax=Caenorhabditis japonica TaxID=281687 RepID=A0A8R1HLG0_CAEJA
MKTQQPLINVEEFYCKYPDVEEGIIAVAKHLTFIFQGPVRLNIVPSLIKNLSAFFTEPHFKICEELEIDGDETVTEEQLAQIFENVTVTKKLIIGPETSVKYAIPKILHIEHLVLQTATWMTREHLLQLNCQYSELRDNTFTCEDLEVFAEHWRKNVRSKIERVWFGWDESKPFKLNEKLRVSRWDATKREREIIYTNQDGTRERLDCSDGYDFEREDGMLATFKFEDDVMCPGVHFLVWHERFPERKRLAELPKVLAPYYKQLEEINREYPNSSSLERMLANPSLKYDEFIDTFHILRSMDHEYHPVSLGRSARRRVFDRIYSLIDISD